MTAEQLESQTRAAVAFNILLQRGEFDRNSAYDLFWEQDSKQWFVDVYDALSANPPKYRFAAKTLEDYAKRLTKQLIMEPISPVKVL